MKKILLSIFIFIPIWSFSQTKVNLKFYDNCSDKIINAEYSLYNLNDFDSYYFSNDKDSILKVDAGKYIVDVSIKDGENYKNFNFEKEFEDKVIYNDTIELPKILRKRTSVLHYPTDLGFYFCEKLCNGQVVDYYKNGSIRMSGEFKNGIPKNEIKKYNRKGQLIEIEIYNENGVYKNSKYPNNNNPGK